MSANCNVSVFFSDFSPIWGKSGSLIPALQSVKLIFSLTVTFYQKNAHVSKIKRVLVLKVYFLKLYVCVLTYQISKNPQNTSTPKNGPLKSPPRLKLNLVFQETADPAFPFCRFAVSVSGLVIFVDQQYLHFKTLKLLKLSFFSIQLLQGRIMPKCKNIFIQQYFLKKIHPFH